MMLAPMLPDNAPFSPEQRAWLNGFFAGLLSADDGTASQSSALPFPGIAFDQPEPKPTAKDPLDDGDDGEAPWHDPSLALDERMAMAEERPLRRRMMAAMAQQDCGQCGYTCEDYSNALFLKDEERLNLCVPGGKATARMLKKLYAEMDNGAGDAIQAKETRSSPAMPAGEPGRSRENPVDGVLLDTRLLNKGGSEKETRHVDIDLSASGLDYQVGDSLGVFATNCPELADQVIAALGADAEDEVGDGNGHSRGLRQALSEDCALSPAPDALFELLAGMSTDPNERQKLAAMAEGEDPDGDLESLDVLAVLEKFPALKPSPRAFVQTLEPLQPRLYSISSSPKAKPGRVSLTVDTVRYKIADRERKGVASTFLADRVASGERLRLYVQKAHGFALPADGATPIIMVGPGTGVAPFRAFLQEREATDAGGPAWLFFGHQRRESDFFYEDEFQAFLDSGILTRLTTAFSRDQAEKIYVQQRMREEGKELYRWLKDGAHFYICGDATRMAADVERALIDVLGEHGGMNAAAVKSLLAEMTAAGRYQKDVY